MASEDNNRSRNISETQEQALEFVSLQITKISSLEEAVKTQTTQIFELKKLLQTKDDFITNLLTELDSERKTRKTSENHVKKLRQVIVELNSEISKIINDVNTNSVVANQQDVLLDVDDVNAIQNTLSSASIKFDYIKHEMTCFQIDLEDFNEQLETLQSISDERRKSRNISAMPKISKSCPKKENPVALVNTKSILKTDAATEPITRRAIKKPKRLIVELENGDGLVKKRIKREIDKRIPTVIKTEDEMEKARNFDGRHRIDKRKGKSEQHYCLCERQFDNVANLRRHVNFFNRQRQHLKRLKKEPIKTEVTKSSKFTNSKGEHIMSLRKRENVNSKQKCTKASAGILSNKPTRLPRKKTRPMKVAKNTTTTQKRVHGRDFKRRQGFYCLCGNTKFKSKMSLISHIKYFTSQWNFKCKFCRLSFPGANYLRKHLITSHGANPGNRLPTFGCRGCGSFFKTLGDLVEHRRAVHIKNEQKSEQNAQKQLTGR